MECYYCYNYTTSSKCCGLCYECTCKIAIHRNKCPKCFQSFDLSWKQSLLIFYGKLNLFYDQLCEYNLFSGVQWDEYD